MDSESSLWLLSAFSEEDESNTEGEESSFSFISDYNRTVDKGSVGNIVDVDRHTGKYIVLTEEVVTGRKKQSKSVRFLCCCAKQSEGNECYTCTFFLYFKTVQNAIVTTCG